VEKDSMADHGYLPEEEKHWEISVHGRYVEHLEDNLDAEYSFDLNLELNGVETESVLDVVYPQLVNRFEEEYGDTVDRLQYLAPERFDD
jgi:hypothetical protein